MGSPYLNSGEAIILTTNRVSSDAVLYDIMLTSERIFLIDNRNARFEPRIIPLSVILSVQGGKTPAQDPVITLLFRSGEAGGERQPLNLVFSQNPAENRKPERDDWMRSLIQLSINLHEREVVPEKRITSETPRETGLRPLVRHGIAPEKVRPLSNIVDRGTPVTPVTIIPDEVEGSGEIPARASPVTPVREERLSSEQVMEESDSDLTPFRESPSRRADSIVRVIIPRITEEPLPAPEPLRDEEPAMAPAVPAVETGPEQATPVPSPAAAEPQEVVEIVEEILPAPAETASPDELEPAPPEDTGAQVQSLQTAVPSLTVTERPAPEPLQDTEPAMAPVVPVVEKRPEQDAAVPAADEPREVVEIVEKILPAPAETASPDEQEPAPLKDTEGWDHPLQTEVRPLTVAEKPAPEPLRNEEPAMAPAVPVVETGAEQAAAVPPPAAVAPRDVAEIIRALHTGAVEPVTSEPPLRAVPEPVHENPEAGIQEIPEPHITFTIPDNAAQESISHPVRETVFPQEPVAQEALPVRHPTPPAREIRPFRTTLAYTAVLLLVVALVAAGVVLLLSQGSGRTDNPVSPTVTMVQVTLLPPETVLPTTVPPATETPAATRIAASTPPLPASPVPQAGVWVRVNSTAYYIGTVGNPGLMQQVSGTGDYFYKVLRSDRPVQVSVRKQDNSGALLAVAIFRDGTLMSARSVTSPMGTVDLLIDPMTGRAPGLTENDTLPEHAATPTGLENY